MSTTEKNRQGEIQQTGKRTGHDKAPRPLRRELKAYFARVIAAMAVLLLLITVVVIRLWNLDQNIISEVKYGAELYRAELAHYKWVSALEKSLNYGQEFEGQLDPTKCSLGQLLTEEADSSNADRRAFVEKISGLHEQIHASARQILELPDTDKQQKQDIFLNTTTPAVEQLIESLTIEIDAGMQRVTADQTQFIILLVAGSIICLLCMAYAVHSIGDIYRFFDREVTGVLERISGKAAKLAEGHLDLTFDCQSSVEELITLRDSMQFAVQELSRYVNAISDGMQEFAEGNLTARSEVTFLGDFAPIEQSIDGFAENISGALYKVEEAAESVAESSDQIAAAVQELAEGATSQAESVQVLLDKSGHVTDSVQATAAKLNEANELVKKAEGIVGAQRQQMNQVSEAMDTISKCSKEIKAISDTVKGIAAQTNLLALNASIEAARAGSAGKGFAVVAESIKELAMESADSTERIQNMITSTIRAVQDGDGKVKETVENFDEIVHVTQGISDKIAEVSGNAQKESQAILQIKDETQNISEMVLNSSAVSQENAAASTELANQAQILKDLTSHFRLRTAK